MTTRSKLLAAQSEGFTTQPEAFLSDDHLVTVTLQVQVAHWHDNPVDATRTYLAQKLGPEQSKYDWAGKFLIVTGSNVKLDLETGQRS